MTARLVLPAGAVLWPLLLVSPGHAADMSVEAELVEQNGTGTSGTVTLTTASDGDLRVRITATGLTPGPHAQHIHGAAEGGPFQCASMDNDTDGNGWLTIEEAGGEYGDVFLALTTTGDTTAKSGLALDRMPVADDQGAMTYDRTFPAASLPEGLVENLQHLHVVQHGVDANENGEYDLDGLGESTFAKALGVPGVPEEATAPAACGMILGAAAGHAPHGGVETGGGEATGGGGSADGSVGWAVFGTALLSVAAGLEVRRRRDRRAGRL